MPAPWAPAGLTASHEQHRCTEARSGPGRSFTRKDEGHRKVGKLSDPPTPHSKGRSKPSRPASHPEQQCGNIAGGGMGRYAELRSAAPTYRRAPRPPPRAQVRGAEGRRRSPGAAAGPRPWACGTGRAGRGAGSALPPCVVAPPGGQREPLPPQLRGNRHKAREELMSAQLPCYSYTDCLGSSALIGSGYEKAMQNKSI